MTQKTSNAFVAAACVALGTGIIGLIVGLWRAEMGLNESGIISQFSCSDFLQLFNYKRVSDTIWMGFL